MILQIKDISKTVTIDKLNFLPGEPKKEQHLQVLKDISFEIEEGSFTTLIGPSGCGKSTLLRIVAGLVKKDKGELVTDFDQTKMSFVFQNFALFPYLTVLENVEFGIKMRGVKKDERQKQVKNLIEEVGLAGFEDKHPQELSGGMRQRVGIARALAIEPELLLLDEPFSALDEFTAEKLRKLLLDLWQNRNFTVLMVTHLVREALELSDQIIVLTKRPGTVKKIIDNKLERPRNERSEAFFKMEDQLKGLIEV